MSEKKERIAVSRDHLIRANKSLKSAKILFEQVLVEDSISRSYYSIYHSIYAMLHSIGKYEKTHKGQMHLFYTHFVVTERVSKEINRKINKILNSRSDADYGSIPILNEEDAEDAVDISEKMYDIAMKWIESI